MDAGVRYRIALDSEDAAQSGRAGVIEEVLAHDPPRFRVRWDDGRTSIFVPSAGVASIERSKKQRVKVGAIYERTRHAYAISPRRGSRAEAPEGALRNRERLPRWR